MNIETFIALVFLEHTNSLLYAFVEWQTLYFPNYFLLHQSNLLYEVYADCGERKLFTTHFYDYFATIYLVIIMVICIRNDLSWT
jgi:hypothetical protein